MLHDARVFTGASDLRQNPQALFCSQGTPHLFFFKRQKAETKGACLVLPILAEYSDWPGLAQVFKLERQRTNALGISKTQVRYGVSSLPAHLANPKRLLALTRGHWGMENGLHYRRDVTLDEDHSQLRMGHAPEMLAVLNTIVLGLFARQGVTDVAEARRAFAYHLDCALASQLA